jgi:Flp pilus assembly protein TadG
VIRNRTERREGERGQALVLFAILLVAIIGAAGVLVDGGMAWANRRQAQSAADLAALAAAKALADAGFPCTAAGKTIATTAANAVAGFNGFNTVTVDYPATGGSHNGCTYVKVSVSRPMDTTFSRVVGQNQWTPSASAVVMVASMQAAGGAKCTFCSLNSSNDNHTLLVQLGSTLIVDGEIYVNSSNGLKNGDPTTPVKLNNWYVGGDGFDIFGAGGRIQASKISVVGGWETHDNGIAVATTATCAAADRPDPIAYATLSPPIHANVCIHQPKLADPLANYPTPIAGDYPTRSATQAKYTGNQTYNLQPGVYIGGIQIAGTANVVMAPGLYYIQGGGFSVGGSASVSAVGVTIYNGSGVGKKGAAGDVEIKTKGTVTLSAPTTGPTAGMTIFMDRLSSKTITLQPESTTQCASTAASGSPQGCIGGISGTIYAAHEDAIVIVKAAGTANLQIISGRLLINNGSTARFTYNSSGFAAAMTTIQLVE